MNRHTTNLAKIFITLSVLAHTGLTAATVCAVDDAAVIGKFQWDDGNIFVEFDRAIGCGCSQGDRAAFHKDGNERFFVAAALTAIATGRRVNLKADSAGGGCPIHGNTAKLIMLGLKRN